jgi:hypothetical protein
VIGRWIFNAHRCEYNIKNEIHWAPSIQSGCSVAVFFFYVLDKNGRAAMNSSGSEPATNRPTTAYPTECIGTYPDTRAAVQGPPANPRRRLASRELPRGGLRPATCEAQALHLSPVPNLPQRRPPLPAPTSPQLDCVRSRWLLGPGGWTRVPDTF